jgi:hypothetical protein
MGSTPGSSAPLPSDLEALTRFAIGNDKLERLEALINQFNIFEALGVARQELRHSDFLAFLLDPRQHHGLGDCFLKRFLQAALSNADSPPPLTPLDIELLTLDHMVPYRERLSIDVLLLDEDQRIAVIIENKVGSGEHSGQLERYEATVRQQYPGWKVIPVFLTPSGDAPSESSYIPIDYKAICGIVEGLAESRQSSLEPEVHGLLKHYARLLRRYVVEDSEIADLCRQIYEKHQRAIDLILEHRPTAQARRYELLARLVEASDGLLLGHKSHSRLIFVPVEWDLLRLRGTLKVTPSGLILFFEIGNREDRVDLILVLGPGDTELRRTIIDAARAAEGVFRIGRRPGPVWARFYSAKILTERETATLSIDEQQERIRRFWEQFTSQTLPKMTASLHLPGMQESSGATLGS